MIQQNPQLLGSAWGYIRAVLLKKHHEEATIFERNVTSIFGRPVATTSWVYTQDAHDVGPYR